MPLRRGEHLLVVGDCPSVTEAAHLLGAHVASVVAPQTPSRAEVRGEVIRAPAGPLPFETGSIDHAIVPSLEGDLTELAAELARILRPGGGLFVGTDPRAAGPARPRLSPAEGRRVLEGAGFVGVRPYRLRSLRRPRHLVPVDSAEAVRWYVRSSYPAVTLRQAITRRMVSVLGWRRAAAVLLPAQAFTARRGEP